MISVTSITDKYILQPSLLNKHRKTLVWLSAATHWKMELAFFQKLIDQYASKFSTPEDKKRMAHFQNVITYYRSELVDYLSSRLRLHERTLAEMLEFRDEKNMAYFKEHDELMNEFEALEIQFVQHKEELFRFIEKVM